MKYFFVLLVLLVSLLAFGCTAQQGSPQTNAQGTSRALPAGAQAGVQGTPQSSSQGGLSGMGYKQLIALGQPVECTIRVSGQEGATAVSHAFFKSGKWRIETSTSVQGENYNGVSVFKDNAVYAQVLPQQKQSGINCDWIVYPVNETQESTEQRPISEDELREIPPNSFVCSYASFGDEKFDTPGTTCTIQQMMQSAIQSARGREGGTPSVDAETLETICANPSLTPQARSIMGCP